MGVDMEDYDGDGLLDIVVTNFQLETHGLYKNLGATTFSEYRYISQLAEPTIFFLAFGVDFADLDQDGDLDLVIANGHINENPEEYLKGATYAQRNQVFENVGNGKLKEDKATGMDVARVSRGLATGDLDGDGDLEVVFGNSNDRPELYENLTQGGKWLAVELIGAKSNRAGIGARLELAAGGKTRILDVRTGSSFESQNALAAHFGLGTAAAADRLTVRWPSGKVQVFTQLPAGRKVRIAE
jgi:hypothetical protein